MEIEQAHDGALERGRLPWPLSFLLVTLAFLVVVVIVGALLYAAGSVPVEVVTD